MSFFSNAMRNLTMGMGSKPSTQANTAASKSNKADVKKSKKSSTKKKALKSRRASDVSDGDNEDEDDEDDDDDDEDEDDEDEKGDDDQEAGAGKGEESSVDKSSDDEDADTSSVSKPKKQGNSEDESVDETGSDQDEENDDDDDDDDDEENNIVIIPYPASAVESRAQVSSDGGSGSIMSAAAAEAIEARLQNPSDFIKRILSDNVHFYQVSEDLCILFLPHLISNHQFICLLFRYELDSKWTDIAETCVNDVLEAMDTYEHSKIEVHGFDYQTARIDSLLSTDDLSVDALQRNLIPLLADIEYSSPHICHIPVLDLDLNRYTFGRILSRQNPTDFPMRSSWLNSYVAAAARLQARKNALTCKCLTLKCTYRKSSCGISTPTTVERRFLQYLRMHGRNLFLSSFEVLESEVAMYETYGAWQEMRALDEELLSLDLSSDNQAALLAKYRAWLSVDILSQLQQLHTEVSRIHSDLNSFIDASLKERIIAFGTRTMHAQVQEAELTHRSLIEEVNELSKTDMILNSRQVQRNSKRLEDRQLLTNQLDDQLRKNKDLMYKSFEESQLDVNTRKLEHEQCRDQDEQLKIQQINTINENLRIDLQTLENEYNRNKEKLRQGSAALKLKVQQRIDPELEAMQQSLAILQVEQQKQKNELEEKIDTLTNAHNKLLHQALQQIDSAHTDRLKSMKMEIEKEYLEKKSELNTMTKDICDIPVNFCKTLVEYLQPLAQTLDLTDLNVATELEPVVRTLTNSSNRKH